ncbi:immunity 49 family protein [Nocardia sp. NPDC057668]|uniref:immunity 49 family protein n=1 Tax=Nocardia sp. NPDC057668 TaxID=3346202 RepID=UPI00366D8A18
MRDDSDATGFEAVPRHAIDGDAIAVVDAGSVAPIVYEIPMPKVRPDGPNFPRTFCGVMFARALVWDPAAAQLPTLDLARLTMTTLTSRFREQGITAGFDRFDRVPGWRAAFWWALIARDEQVLRELTAYPVERLRATGGTDFDDFQYDWAELLQTARVHGPEYVADRAFALEATSRVGAQRPVDLLLRPSIEVFARLASGDQDGFTWSLANALRLHRTFFEQEPWSTDPEGVIALPLLGLACWAHDRGLRVEVESEYLPTGFVHRPHWLGELSTAVATFAATASQTRSVVGDRGVLAEGE